MNFEGSNQVLSDLASHNEWANQKLFHACADLNPDKLLESTSGYDSVIGILNHLVQVEHSFFELAHGRQPQRLHFEDLLELQKKCTKIDLDYIKYVKTLNTREVGNNSFLVPWFGFEITVLEGIIQPLTHSHKHRADISMLLPILGGTGIEMDFIQWIDVQRGEGSN